jgi:hypothetical protein
MTRSRFLVVWIVVVGLLAATSLSAAEKNAAKPAAKRPKAQFSAVGVENPFAKPRSDGKLALSKTPVKSPPASPAKHPRKPMTPQLPWRPGVAEAKIEQALASMTEMDFADSPLGDIVDYLKEVHKIEIQLDKRILEDVNVSRETPVTINVKGVCLRSALRLMLRNVQPSLTYMIKDEVLLITTPEVYDEELITKVYPVGDLVACRDEHDAPWDDYDTLIDVIAGIVKVSGWDMVGGPGAIRGCTLGTAKVLIVTQTREVHEEIVALLASVREIAKKDPGALTPRRSRVPRSTEGNAQRGERLLGGTSGAAAGAGAPSATQKPGEKATDAVKPSEQKPPTAAGGGSGGFF